MLEADLTGERQVLLELGRLLCEQGEYARALDVYTRLLAHGPGDEAAQAGQRRAREGLEAMAMPLEYGAIAEAARVTRADLAALVAVRVPALRRAGAGGAARGRRHLGIVGPRPGGARARARDHGRLSQPHLPAGRDRAAGRPRACGGAHARRAALCRAEAAPTPSDMSRAHLDFAVVERVLAAGLMGLTPAGAFEPWRPVSGREAIDVVDAVARLSGP